MNTSLNKPTETNPLLRNDERYVLVSQGFPQQEDGMDLVDLVIAAWNFRVLFTISWVILAVITFGVLQAFNTTNISTEIRSGFLDKTPIQTPDAMRDQISKLIFPSSIKALEQQLQRPVTAKINTDIKKTSDYLKLTIAASGLSDGQLDECMKSVVQNWIEGQALEIKKNTQATQERIALITQEIAAINDYSGLLNSPTDPLQQSEIARLRLQAETKKQQLFDLQLSIQNIDQPIVATPFSDADASLARGIKGVAVSAFIGAALACCVVFALNIICKAKTRLANS